MFTRFLPFLSLLNLAGLLVLITLHFTGREKAVYVDSSKLINQYQGMIAARQAYQGKVGVWQANLDTLAGEAQRELARYQQESASMSAKERELAGRLLQTKQQQLADYQKATSEKAGQEDAVTTKKCSTRSTPT
jgi:outer membrane protein